MGWGGGGEEIEGGGGREGEGGGKLQGRERGVGGRGEGAERENPRQIC